MSESRKSDGDMLEEDLESCSLASVTLECTHDEEKKKTLDQGKNRAKEEEVTVQKAGVKPYLSPSSSSKLPGSDGTWKPEKCNACTHSRTIR